MNVSVRTASCGRGSVKRVRLSRDQRKRLLRQATLGGQFRSLGTDGDDVSGIGEALGSAGVCDALFSVGAGSSSASWNVFLTPCQKLLVRTSFIWLLACP